MQCELHGLAAALTRAENMELVRVKVMAKKACRRTIVSDKSM